MSSNYPPHGGVITQSCQRCRMTLPPNEARCGNCGFMNAPGQGVSSPGGIPASMPPGGPVSQVPSGPWSSPGGGPTSGPQWGRPVSQGGPGGAYSPPSMPGLSRPGNNAKPPVNKTLSSVMGRDLFHNQPVSKTRVMMGVIVLIILIVSGSVIGVVYFASKSAPKTPTVVPIPTPAVPAIFGDPFNDNTYGWNLQSEPGKYSVQIGGGNLTLEDSNHKLLWEPLPGQRSYDDFKLFVDAKLSKGDDGNGYGVYIRGASSANSDLATYYRFALYGDGGYAIFKGNGSGSTKLVDWTPSTAINKAGKLNHILITAQGSSLTFTVNGQELKTISDSDYTKGTIAFFVSNVADAKAGAQVQFSNFGVYPLKA